MTEKSGIIAVTERLTLRRLHEDDLSDLARIFGDPETMYAYEGAFSDAETRDWLDRMLRRYHDDGISLYAVILNATGEFIGQCRLTMQDIPGARVVEVGYLFRVNSGTAGTQPKQRRMPRLCLQHSRCQRGVFHNT